MKPDTSPGAPGRTPFFYGWTIVGACFLAQNFAIGITFGGYSPLLQALEERFDASRGMAAAGLSMVSLALGLMAPIIGSMLHKYSVRNIMMFGAALMAAGFALIPLAPNIYVMLAIYAVMIGVGAVCLSTVPGSTLITRWFVHRRGLALGIITTMVGMILFPLMVSFLLVNFGFDMVYLVQAGLMVLLLPVLLLIVDHPKDRGLQPLGAEAEAEMPADIADNNAAAAPAPISPPADTRPPTAQPVFWFLSLGIALFTATATMLSIHLVPMLTGAGATLPQAAMIYSVFGLAITVGAPLSGMVIDRIGPMASALCSITLSVVCWLAIALMPANLGVYGTLAVLLGIASGSIVPLHTSAAAVLFSQDVYSRVIGNGYLIKMPFLFVAGPAGGFIYDATRSYNAAFFLAAIVAAIAGAMFALLYVAHGRKKTSPAT